MSTQVPFIDREEQLTLIENAIKERGKRQVIYIQADGGIGKSRLLQEVRERCRRWDPALWARKPGSKKLTIAVVNEFTKTEWADRFRMGIQTIAAEQDIDLLQTDANYDIGKMTADLDEVIQKSPDAIVIRLGTDEKIRPGIARALAAKIPVITVDNYLPRLSSITASVTTDEHHGAYLSSEMLVRDIGYRGKVVALSVEGVAMQERRKSLLKSLLNQYVNNIELIAGQIQLSKDMSQKAYQKTIDLLQKHPDTKAIWITWDEFSRGVVSALQASNRTDIGVYSFDLLSPEDIELMAQAGSPWKATVAIDPASIGRMAIQLASTAASGKPVAKHYAMPMEFITQADLRSRRKEFLSAWERFGHEPIPHLLVPEIVDFDELAFRPNEQVSVEVLMADIIGRRQFDDFYQELRSYNEVKEAPVSEEVVHRQETRLQNSFLACLKSIAEKQRIILLLDTAEKAREDLHFILDIVSKIDNVLLILAGRPDKKTIGFLQDSLGSQIQKDSSEGQFQLIDLPPLEDTASKLYLEEKLKILNVTMQPAIEEKLLYMAAGKPILIDLAVEWRVRNDTLEWLTQKSLTGLKKIPPKEKNRLRKEFESELVSHIAQTRTDMDKLILLLSQVYPLDESMVEELLNIPSTDAEDLLEEGKSYVFIKTLPNGQISLHDEMRRLVNEYAWPEVDPDEEWRYKISKSAARYLQKQIDSFCQRIQAIREVAAGGAAAAPVDIDQWRHYHDYVEKVWMLKEHLLRHLMLVDKDEGLRLFIGMFDDATSNYRYTPRLEWIGLVEAQAGKLSSAQISQVLIRKAKALLDNGRFTEASRILKGIPAANLNPEQQVDAHIQQANILVRQGDLDGGIRSFKKAVKASKKNKLPRWLVKAENGLGWAYRLTADLDSALEHYEIALGLAIDLDLQHEQAMLYNNLGFLYAYKKDVPGFYDTAVRYSTESLRLAQALGEKRGIGRACSALGSIFFMAGDTDQALEYFQEALDIFEPTNDEEWMGIVYTWRGAAYISKPYNDLQLAEKDLLRAREINITKDQPMVLSRLGLIYLLTGRLKEAEEAILECRRLAQNLPDYWYQWVSIRDMARLARFKKEYTRLDELEKEMNAHLERHPRPDRRAWGMLEMELGNLALGLNQDQRAAGHYHKGMKILTETGNYGGDTPTIYLERLETEVFHDNLHLSDERIRTLGTRLLNLWQAERLGIHYPDIRSIFSGWARFGEVRK